MVAGVGLVTPLGVGAWSTYASLLAGRRITDRIEKLEPDTEAVPLVQAVGGVSVARHTATDPAVELAERAAREAAGEAGTALQNLPTWLGTSKGAVGAMSEAVTQRMRGGMRGGDEGGHEGGDEGGHEGGRAAITPDRALAVALGPHGYLAHHLALRTGLSLRSHCVAACASSLTALHQARTALIDRDPLMRPRIGEYALVLTAEAALLPPFIHSYRRLGVLAPLTLDGYRGRPLAAQREGFILAEVGAAVLLQRLPPANPPPPGRSNCSTPPSPPRLRTWSGPARRWRPWAAWPSS